MPEVLLHRLTGTKKALAACELVDAMYRAGRRITVFFVDVGRAATFDEYLWTFSQSSFVPHALASPAAGSDDPVVIVVGEVPEDRTGDVLLVVDGLPPVGALDRFSEIHDIVAQSVEDAGRPERWTAVGVVTRDAGAVGRPAASS